MIKFLLLPLFFLTPLLAQEKKESHKHFRVLCLGDLPPWKETIKNGVRVQMEPPAGSLPPRRLALGNEKPFTNRLGSISPPQSYRADETQLVLTESGQSWQRFPSPKSSHSLVLVTRGKKDWRKPISKNLPDDLASFPAGKIRIINASHLPVRFRIGEEGKILKIGPGKGLLRDIEPGEAFLQVEALNSKGKRFRIFRNVVSSKAGERVNAIIYRADGVKPRRPLKLFLAAERAANYQPPKKSKL